jgi:plastocyanin
MPVLSETIALLAAAEGESSQTAFYVAGGVLAVWAVIVSALGIRRPDFARSPGAARAVMGLSAVLVVVVLVSAVVTAEKPAHEEEAHGSAPAKPATTSAPPGARGATTLALAADPEGDLAFDKKELEAKAGKVAINLANRSQLPHNVVVEKGSENVASSETVTEATTSLTADLEAGEYTFYCSVAGHRDGGMEGTLTVE